MVFVHLFIPVVMYLFVAIPCIYFSIMDGNHPENTLIVLALWWLLMGVWHFIYRAQASH